mmetsp:Transcript_90949/g.291667  ORF Transcript_90949/g.291667 Transcript_90949/m.291667 type:complete len:329 (-) Transcript_90949:44-1030(-)
MLPPFPVLALLLHFLLPEALLLCLSLLLLQRILVQQLRTAHPENSLHIHEDGLVSLQWCACRGPALALRGDGAAEGLSRRVLGDHRAALALQRLGSGRGLLAAASLCLLALRAEVLAALRQEGLPLRGTPLLLLLPLRGGLRGPRPLANFRLRGPQRPRPRQLRLLPRQFGHMRWAAGQLGRGGCSRDRLLHAALPLVGLPLLDLLPPLLLRVRGLLRCGPKRPPQERWSRGWGIHGRQLPHLGSASTNFLQLLRGVNHQALEKLIKVLLRLQRIPHRCLHRKSAHRTEGRCEGPQARRPHGRVRAPCARSAPCGAMCATRRRELHLG